MFEVTTAIAQPVLRREVVSPHKEGKNVCGKKKRIGKKTSWRKNRGSSCDFLVGKVPDAQRRA